MTTYTKSLKTCVSSYRAAWLPSKGGTTWDQKYRHWKSRSNCLFKSIRPHPEVSSLTLSEANSTNSRRWTRIMLNSWSTSYSCMQIREKGCSSNLYRNLRSWRHSSFLIRKFEIIENQRSLGYKYSYYNNLMFLYNMFVYIFYSK